VRSHFFDRFDEVVTDARADTSTGFDANARINFARSTWRMIFRSRHARQVNQKDSWIVAMFAAAVGYAGFAR